MMNSLHYFASSSLEYVKPVFSFFFGNPDSFFLALLTLLILDHLVGRACRSIQHKHASDIATKDIIKKFMIIILVGVSHIIDDILFSKPALRTVVISFYIGNQGLSILAFADELGMPVPEKLKEILAQIRDKDKEEINKSKQKQQKLNQNSNQISTKGDNIK